MAGQARPRGRGPDQPLAAFNSAFRVKDARGGVYAFGHTRGRLVPGAASLVLDSRGRIDVGAWGQEISMTPSTQVVRQNLVLLVDGGLVAPGIGSNKDHRWGATLGNSYYVWRSGIGVTADGAAVYVAGDRLNALSLANLLQRAGAVRAMELDINRDWTSFVVYRSPRGRDRGAQRAARHAAVADPVRRAVVPGLRRALPAPLSLVTRAPTRARTSPRVLVRALRPRQWTKNLLVYRGSDRPAGPCASLRSTSRARSRSSCSPRPRPAGTCSTTCRTLSATGPIRPSGCDPWRPAPSAPRTAVLWASA